MLLVSQEEQGGHTAAAVGGGSVLRGRTPLPVIRAPRKLRSASSSALVPETLPEGVSVATLGLAAGCWEACRYELEGNERVEWRCDVADGYTVDLCAKVARTRGRSGVRLGGRHLGLVGVDSNRIVSESRRAACIDGFVDLGGEHAGCFGEGEGPLTLTLEFDNSFSFFRSKTIDVKLTKTCPAAATNGEGDEHQAAWQTHPESPPNSVQGVRPWLSSVDLGGEDGAMKMSPESSPDELRDKDLVRLSHAISEAIRLCPSQASTVLCHLQAAQGSLDSLTTLSRGCAATYAW